MEGMGTPEMGEPGLFGASRTVYGHLARLALPIGSRPMLGRLASVNVRVRLGIILKRIGKDKGYERIAHSP